MRSLNHSTSCTSQVICYTSRIQIHVYWTSLYAFQVNGNSPAPARKRPLKPTNSASSSERRTMKKIRRAAATTAIKCRRYRRRKSAIPPLEVDLFIAWERAGFQFSGLLASDCYSMYKWHKKWMSLHTQACVFLSGRIFKHTVETFQTSSSLVRKDHVWLTEVRCKKGILK